MVFGEGWIIRSLEGGKQAVVFLRLIFGSFFRWWWAAITGFASIAGFLIALQSPAEGVLLSPLLFGILILLGSLLVFLVLSTVYRSWLIYREHFTRLRVVGLSRYNDPDPSDLFILEGNAHYNQGTVIELQRFHEGLDIAIALVEIMEKNSAGQYPAKVIWAPAGPLGDLRMGKFMFSDIKAGPLIREETIQKAIRRYRDPQSRIRHIKG